MNNAALKKLLASPTPDPYGWIVTIPETRGTLFGQQLTIRFETRLLPAKKPPPEINADEQQLAGLVVSNLSDLLVEVARRFDAYHKNKKKIAELRGSIRNPHIWISREIMEDEGPDRWSFVIGFQESKDYAIDMEFDGLKCLDVAGGD